jgi:hypothetical protein
MMQWNHIIGCKPWLAKTSNTQAKVHGQDWKEYGVQPEFGESHI